ncbi:hypothetical protein ACPV5U_23395 [Vibrio mediterranei]
MKTKAPLTNKQKGLIGLFLLLLLATGGTIAWDYVTTPTITTSGSTFSVPEGAPVNLQTTPPTVETSPVVDTEPSLEAETIRSLPPAKEQTTPNITLSLSDDASEALKLMEEEALLTLKTRKQTAERQQLTQAQSLRALTSPKPEVKTPSTSSKDTPSLASKLDVRSITQIGKNATVWLALEDELIPATVGTRILDVTVRAIHRNSVVLEEAGKRTTRYLKKPLQPEKELSDANS